MNDRFLVACLSRAALGLTAAVACLAVAAQTTEPAGKPADAKAAEESAMQRAQRDADKVFKIILLNADSPRAKREAAKAAAAAAAPATPVAPAPSPKPAVAKAEAPAARSETPTAKAEASPARGSTTATAAAAAVAPPASPASDTVLAIAAPHASAPPPPAGASAPEADDDDEVVTLEMTRQVMPRFRRELMDELRKGSVKVKFEIRPDGSVGQAEVLKSSHRGLNNAATFAVSQWRFKPISEARQAVVDLDFDLDQ
ncbi:energy transducer TonB [Caldimonas sp. KR1-144]|uniref:energy transducer TonB n=1 Tax=Caldimonas sp. KR1-144 TaxID=3400911 RepID=UPI003C0DA7E7